MADESVSIRLSPKQQKVIVDASSVMLAPGAYASESDWHHAIMTTLMPLTGAYKSAIRTPDPSGLRMTPIGFEESAINEHRDYYHRFDFGRALGERPVLGNVFSRNDYYGPRFSSFQRTEYYADYISRYAVFDALCLSSETRHHDKGTVLYLWHERELSADARRTALAILRLLAPAFCAGTAMRRQLDRWPGELSAAFDGSSDGYAIYNQAGMVLYRNRSLEQLLAIPANSVRMNDAIAATMCTLRSTTLSHGTRIENLPNASTRHFFSGVPFTISACLLAQVDTPKFVVTVVRKSATSMNPGDLDRISDFSGLTKRELEVAALLGERKSNQEIATHLGMSEHTARHHTENILRKLGVASRTEVAKSLAELLSRLARFAHE